MNDCCDNCYVPPVGKEPEPGESYGSCADKECSCHADDTIVGDYQDDDMEEE